MTHDVADCHQRYAVPEQRACHRMPHGVCNFAALYCQSSLPHIPLDGFGQSGTGGNRTIRMDMTDKHVIAIRVQSPVFQIIDDCFTNWRQQRQCVDFPGFLLRIGDHFFAPVDFFEL